MDLNILVVREHVGVDVDDIPSGDTGRHGAICGARRISNDHVLAA